MSELDKTIVTINAIDVKDGVITDFAVELTVKEVLTKDEFLGFFDEVIEDDNEYEIFTKDGTRVIIVDNEDGSRHFRTVGDDSNTNDLMDLPRITN